MLRRTVLGGMVCSVLIGGTTSSQTQNAAKKWRIIHVLPAAPDLMGPLAVAFERPVGAPVDIGLVNSLSSPSGNMTGVTFEAATETYGTRLQLLAEAVPNLERVAVLRTTGDANTRFGMASLEKAAPQLGVTLQPVDIRSADELPAAFETMKAASAQALIVISSAVAYGAVTRTGELTLAHRLPSCHPFRETVRAAGLLSLGPDTAVMARQGADYVHKIMAGSRTSDLPVMQPARYEMYVNLKAAKAIGLDLPATILARADQVIE